LATSGERDRELTWQGVAQVGHTDSRCCGFADNQQPQQIRRTRGQLDAGAVTGGLGQPRRPLPYAPRLPHKQRRQCHRSRPAGRHAYHPHRSSAILPVQQIWTPTGSRSARDPALGHRHSTLCLTTLGRRADALLRTRQQPPPPAHPISQRQLDRPVVLGQSSKIAFAPIRHDLLAVVVDQVHVSALSFSTAASL
jgi:hypothetical protein